MIAIINLIVFTIGSWFFFRELMFLKKGHVNAYMLMTMIFYIFQVFPLFVDTFWGDELDYIRTLPNLLSAMQDSQVAIIYDIFSLFVIWYFYRFSIRRNIAFYYFTSKFRNIQFGFIINALLVSLIFLPIVFVVFAPTPAIYLQWAYSYNNEFSYLEEIYHSEIMMPVLQISSFAVIGYYSQKKRWNFLVYFAVALITWLTFKRTMLVFLSIIIIGIDFLMNRYSYKNLLRKALVIFAICVSYFIVYSEKTDKGSTETPYESYTMYYGRQYGVKTAIYDQLNGNKMLDYRGQTILFDLFFYVPRTYWPDKPAMYSKYSTAYSKGLSGYEVSTNFYVNIWAEFITNFHLWGIIIALLFMQFFIRISEKSNSVVVYLLSLLMISFYLFWGIQPFTMVLLALWGITYVLSRMGRFWRRMRVNRIKALNFNDKANCIL